MTRPRSSAFAAAAAVACLVPGGCDATGPGADASVFEVAWDGETWRGTAAIGERCDGRAVLSGWVMADDGAYASRRVSVTVPALRQGSHRLGPGDASYEYLTGGDDPAAMYVTADADAGTLVLEEATSDRIRGRVTFEAAAADAQRPAGDRARFEGSFDIRRDGRVASLAQKAVSAAVSGDEAESVACLVVAMGSSRDTERPNPVPASW